MRKVVSSYPGCTFVTKRKSLIQFYPEGTILSSGMSKWASAGGWRVSSHSIIFKQNVPHSH